MTYYRRAIRGEYKQAFDSLMEKASRHKDPIILKMPLMEQLFLSIVLEHEKEIVELRNRSMRQ